MPLSSSFRVWPFLKIVCAVLPVCLIGGGAYLWLAVPDPLPRVLSWPVSPVLLDDKGVLIHARLSSAQEWCLPIPLSEMGDWLPRTLVAVEDKRFYDHAGVDLLALGRAVFQNVKAGRVVSGASTITSQLVRLSIPRERTFASKALEFVGALKLEQRMSKERILEYYLNRAPFGGPIRGVEAAARMYFGKRAKELSLGEAAMLVALLKGPTAYRPDRNPRAALARRQQIIAKVAEQTGFPEDLKALALEEPLPVFRPGMPTFAWHFADLVFATLPPEGGVARSTLDMRVQGLLERVLKEQLSKANSDVTAAGVVVDNRTASIIAYVGNARFNPAARSQWVDCAIAPRSPGSTLKPFIYLKAMEEGDIIPASLLADTPLQLGGEAPRNFDKQYRGPVTAHTALADSLNTPAVRVLRMLGVHSALASLRRAGFSYLDREEDVYGDSLVLGAGEVTVLELARAYAALASLGQDRPLLLRRAPRAPASASEQGRTPREPDAREQAPLEAAGQRHGRSEESGEEPADDPSRRIARLGALEAYGSSLRPEDFPDEGASRWQAVVPLPSGLAEGPAQLAAAQTGEGPVPRRLYSREAAFLIAEILKDPGRLPFLFQLMQVRDNAPVAFKTGTSFGLRDAWTAAYCPAYTVVVWFGRAGGGADPHLVGISMAAPGALAVLRALGAGLAVEKSWYETPSGVGKVRVCALSGAAASPFCPTTRLTQNIRSVWRTVPCDMHVLREGRTVLVWPPELEDFNRKRFSQEDLSRKAQIVSPMPGARYLITPGGRQHPIALKAEGVAYPVHWYADDAYLGSQEREDRPLYWTPTGGEHTVSLFDARERVAAMTVHVTDLGAVREETLPMLGE